MKYREVLEYTKNNPGCLWTKEQRQIHSESKYKEWANRQVRENENEPENKKLTNNRK